MQEAISNTTELQNEHSNEVQEIIGKVPGRILRYGMYCFALVFVLFIFLIWYIRYPEIIPAQITIYANSAPKAVVAHSSGKIISLFTRNGLKVKEGDILGVIESNALYAQVVKLDSVLHRMEKLVSNNQWEQININMFEYDQLGEIQPSFHSFSTAYNQVYALINSNLYNNRKQLISSSIKNAELDTRNLEAQRDNLQKDYQLSEEDYFAQKKLYDGKVISLSELHREESKLLSKKSALKNIQSAISNNTNGISGYRKEILEIDKQLLDARNSFLDYLNKLLTDIGFWKKKYLLTAPISGTVTYYKNLQELQEVTADQIVLYLSSEVMGVYSELYIPQTNFGKIALGQKVVIHLESFPFQEYGSLEGKVSYISNIPTSNSEYLINVSIPADMKTVTGMQISFSNGLLGNAQIVTSNNRVISKLFYSLKAVFQSRPADVKKNNKANATPVRP